MFAMISHTLDLYRNVGRQEEFSREGRLRAKEELAEGFIKNILAYGGLVGAVSGFLIVREITTTPGGFTAVASVVGGWAVGAELSAVVAMRILDKGAQDDQRVSNFPTSREIIILAK